MSFNSYILNLFKLLGFTNMQALVLLATFLFRLNLLFSFPFLASFSALFFIFGEGLMTRLTPWLWSATDMH